MTTLEKIRAEILKTFEDSTSSNRIDPMMRNIGREQCLEIIDKYASEECEHDCEHCAWTECPKGGE